MGRARDRASADLNGQEFILDADADTSISADTDDQIDIKIAGADDFQFTANTFTAQSGSTIAAQALTATTVTASGVVDVTDTTDASDATGDTGALRTEGGASIAKKVYVGTNLNVSGTSTFSDNLTVSEGNPELFLASTGDGGEGSIGFKDDDGNIDGKIAYRTDYSGQTDNYMTFNTNGSNERMRIDSSGNVGIGTDSPSDHLHVKGFVQVEGKAGDGNYIRFDNSANSGNIWRIGPGVYSHTTFSIYNQTENSNVVNIESVNDQLMFRSMTTVDLADDASAIAVANSFQGIVIVTSSSNALTGIYRCEGQNNPTLISGTGSFTNTDTDGKFCLISGANSSNVTFRNRFGATYSFKIASFGVLN